MNITQCISYTKEHQELFSQRFLSAELSLTLFEFILLKNINFNELGKIICITEASGQENKFVLK